MKDAAQAIIDDATDYELEAFIGDLIENMNLAIASNWMHTAVRQELIRAHINLSSRRTIHELLDSIARVTAILSDPKNYSNDIADKYLDETWDEYFQ